MDVKELTKTALKYNNPKAVIALMKTNLYAASSALSTDEGASFLSKQEQTTPGNALIELFFMVRTTAPPKYKKLLKKIARNVIMKTSIKISGRGMQKGIKRKRIQYHPGMAEFDLQMSLSNLMERGNVMNMSYRDIIGVQRKQMKKNVVLILDTSGSMYGKSLLNAALTTSVLSYVMDKHRYAVVLFNSNALVLKKIEDEVAITVIVDQILDSEAVGFTNIEKGLKMGVKELKNIRKHSNKRSIGVLITDGHYNRGENPIMIAKDFPTLHVVGMPSDKNQFAGLRTCREIAKAGGGFFYPVSNYFDIPRALLQILHRS